MAKILLHGRGVEHLEQLFLDNAAHALVADGVVLDGLDDAGKAGTGAGAGIGRGRQPKGREDVGA